MARAICRNGAFESTVSYGQRIAVLSKEGFIGGSDGGVSARHGHIRAIRPNTDAVVVVDCHIGDRYRTIAPGDDSASGIAQIGIAAGDRDTANGTGAAADLDGLLELVETDALVGSVGGVGTAGDSKGAALDANGLTVELVKVHIVQG